MGKIRNRTLNTAGIVPRTIGTGLHTIEDVTKTALYTTLNAFEGIGKTAISIKEAVHNACTKGPWYNRVWKAPLSLAATPFMAIEGVCETLLHTGCNLLRYSRDTIANPFINFGHGIKYMFSSKDPRNFKFEKVEKSDVTPKNRLASLFNTTTRPTTTGGTRPTTTGGTRPTTATVAGLSPTRGTGTTIATAA